MISKFGKTHQTIVKNTIELIGKYGYENVTVESICTASKIGRSTFYNHFKSIDDLIEEHFTLAEQISPEQLAWILSAPTAYEKAIRVQLNFIQESQGPYRVALYNLNLCSYLKKACKDNLDRSQHMKRVLLPLIQPAKDNGEIRNELDAEQICDAAIMIHWGNLFMWGISNGTFERVESIKSALEALYQPNVSL